MNLVKNKNIKRSIFLSKIYWFGDSWVYGDELTDPESDCFATLVSCHYQKECVNLGENSTSIDNVVHKFLKVKDQITESDWVFFFLTESNRKELNGKNLLPNKNEHNYHEHCNMWYKYFYSYEQEQLDLDKNLLLLHLASPQAKFCNIFSLNHSKYVPDNVWLLPSNQCITEFILPHVYKRTRLANEEVLPHLGDHPNLQVNEWEEQKQYVEKYFVPNYGHPNPAGHQRLADKIIELIDNC